MPEYKHAPGTGADLQLTNHLRRRVHHLRRSWLWLARSMNSPLALMPPWTVADGDVRGLPDAELVAEGDRTLALIEELDAALVAAGLATYMDECFWCKRRTAIDQNVCPHCEQDYCGPGA